MSVGCRIVTDIRRPDKALVRRFDDCPVANLDDCMNRTAAVDAGIKPFGTCRILGTAFTVRVPEGDNLMMHKALDLAQEGDVIVVDAGGALNRSICGELMLSYCEIKRIAGVIIDGSIRDSEAVSLMAMPVYARGVSPNGPYKNGPGEIGTVITCGGQVVRPGDIVVGDADGIVFVKPEEAQELLEAVAAVMRKEEEIKRAMYEEGTYIRPWVDAKLKEIGCEF